MYRRLVTIVILASSVAALSATPAAAERSCGTVHAGRYAARVTISRGPMSCAQARAVARSYISGRGTAHVGRGRSRSEEYVTFPGGWRCSGLEQGGASCIGGGSNYLTARDRFGFLES